MEWIDRKLEGYSRPEKHCEPIQHNWDLYYFTQQQDTNSIQVPIDYKQGNTAAFSGKQNKVQKCHGLKVLRSYGVCSFIPVELCQKSISKDIWQ